MAGHHRPGTPCSAPTACSPPPARPGSTPTRTDSPSHGYQVAHGNTTLGGTWDGGSGQSQNHFMLGAIDSWFTGSLAGIRQTDDSIGHRRLLFAPAVVGDLTSVAASYATPYGPARGAWRRDGSAYRLTVTVPAGTTAEVRVQVTSGAVAAPDGARPLRTEDGARVYEVPSGTWSLTSVYQSVHGPRTGSDA